MIMTWRDWLCWIGVVIAIIGFFAAPVYLGAVTVLLGLCSLGGKQKAWAWITIIIGALVVITGLM